MGSQATFRMVQKNFFVDFVSGMQKKDDFFLFSKKLIVAKLDEVARWGLRQNLFK